MDKLTPLMVPGEYPSLRIPHSAKDAVEQCAMDVYEDVYVNVYAKQRHFNWIVTESSSSNSVLSVLATPSSQKEDSQVHQVLKSFSKGYEIYSITVPKGSPKMSSVITRIEEALKEKEQKEFYAVFDNSAFRKEFVKLEGKHPQKRNQFKLGVMYVRDKQVHAKEWFSNMTDLDPRFWTMMDNFGRKIDLTNWDRYYGDMGKKGETYYDYWKDEIDVIFHLSPMLDSEGHRRLVGNDIGVIFFVEEGAQFDPQNLSELGTVPQVYVLIQPVGTEWRVSFFSNINIKYYGPAIPERLLTLAETKEMVLTNIYNGLVMTNYCPPINRLFYVPREDTLKNIIKNFPHVTAKERRALKVGQPDTDGPKLQVTIIAAKKIPAMKAGVLCDVHCLVTVDTQKDKTKLVASQYPVWNCAMVFLLNGIDELFY
eukprot:TRINITY_DN6010_c0_g1_i1.p1 TRINITY_DN6010_c0_g1~~TRINITY_DN6010_c0_g1_i1.p1  ORF type:complete len:425 (-),score=82.27 TRINITY_DN6010_c0_g1_i1:190-1464(-)